ncbi:MAG: hypothetical protein U0610_21830 [bacterium]
MDTKSFHASTVREALGLVKSELGDEAEILDTRAVGEGATRRVEIRARAGSLRALAGQHASDIGLPTVAAGQPAPLAGLGSLLSFAPSAVAPASAAREPTSAATPADASVGSLARDLERVARNVEGFRESLTQITWLTEHFSLGVLSEIEREAYRNLRARGLDARTALTLLTDARACEPLGGWLRDRLLAVLGQRVTVADPPSPTGPRVVVFAGSSGAGKTTLIAKLAAAAQLEGVPGVHLVTTDLFRVGGASELVTYGRLLGIPTHVLREPATLARMIERLDRGWLLIDTAGRAADDPRQRALLAPAVAARDRIEVHLTLNVTTKPEDQLESARRWSWLTPDRAALTHLDETASPGSVLAPLEELERPLSYLSSSGNVPGGLEVARTDLLAGWILGEG